MCIVWRACVADVSSDDRLVASTQAGSLHGQTHRFISDCRSQKFSSVRESECRSCLVSVALRCRRD